MDNLPISNSRYKDRNYWDERYHHEETYEWFGAFSRFEHLLKEEIQTDETILVLGCGNSSLSYELFMSGYRSITNIDFSAICIEKMASKYATCSGMEWKVMDARALQFEDESFDVVLEKGTLDAMMVDVKDPWNVSQETTETIDQVLKEVSRILRKGGRFISITFAQPHFRKQLYAKRVYNWSIKHQTYGNDFHYYFYTMTKGENLSSDDQELENKCSQRTEPQATVYLQVTENEDYLNNIEY
ncbi:EEF1A lysine methyltransferase 4 [Hemiscyllium ocellatum]|uniref:EEF1A lysine methyltransferase 4 n=1 Tax=Hemiscyllium ocellatum TaxID=170820 RepID=UPI002966332D|nr:EEF1A lysine methyltransferase 4 [Hemiscyllium ocellatum]XP_060690090.1 EEF1A lysine methyltransferase 4 [Hemiscyllium ocellatum]